MDKLRWLALVDVLTGSQLERESEPVLGGTSNFFIGSVAPMVSGMSGIVSKISSGLSIVNTEGVRHNQGRTQLDEHEKERHCVREARIGDQTQTEN